MEYKTHQRNKKHQDAQRHKFLIHPPQTGVSLLLQGLRGKDVPVFLQGLRILFIYLPGGLLQILEQNAGLGPAEIVNPAGSGGGFTHQQKGMRLIFRKILLCKKEKRCEAQI